MKKLLQTLIVLLTILQVNGQETTYSSPQTITATYGTPFPLKLSVSDTNACQGTKVGLFARSCMGVVAWIASDGTPTNALTNYSQAIAKNPYYVEVKDNVTYRSYCFTDSSRKVLAVMDSILVKTHACSSGEVATINTTQSTQSGYVTNAQRYIPPSPLAASIGKYSDLTLNQSSGLPNINIPIYTLQEGDIRLPLSMSYHYTGYRPSEESGVLGIGWTLQAGGAIVRTIKGAFPDEKQSSPSGGTPSGYLTSRTAVSQVINAATGTWQCTGGSCPTPNDFLTLYDGEPDTFNFSFGDVSGTFFFGADGNAHITSDRKLQISYNKTFAYAGTYVNNGTLSTITSFTIITEDGTQYNFGMRLNPSGTVQSLNADFNISTSSSGENVINTWYLNQIISPTGNSISFTYANDYVTPTTQNISKYRETKTVTESYITTTQGGGIGFTDPGPSVITNRNTENTLTSISGTNWKVEFNYQETAENANSYYGSYLTTYKMLRNIQILANNSVVQRDSFSYGGGSGIGRYYLLTKLKETGTDTTSRVYKFGHYYTDILPYDGTNVAIDYWGYYNGASINYSAYNTGPTLIPSLGADRSPNLTATQIGAMQTLTYPTGGQVSFVYELNDFSYVRSSLYTSASNSNVHIGTAGGLRVKTLTEDALNLGATVEKNYTYKDFGNANLSSGIVDEITIPYAYSLAMTVQCSEFTDPITLGVKWIFGQLGVNLSVCPPNNTIVYSLFKSEPYYAMSKTPVYYYNVRESLGDGRTDNVFTSHFDYTDFLGNSYGLMDNQVGTYSSKSFARSMLKNSKVYAGNQLVKQTKINYNLIAVHAAPVFNIEPIITTAGNETFAFEKGVNVYSGWFQKVSEEDSTYNSDGSGKAISKKILYTYGNSNHYQLTKQTLITSKNDTLTTNYNYPDDMVAKGVNPLSVYSNMSSSHVINPVIEEIQKLNSVQINRRLTNYQAWFYNLGNFVIKVFYAPTSIQTQVRSTDTLVTQVHFTSYTSKGQPTVFSEVTGLTTTLTWWDGVDTTKAGLLKSYAVAGGGLTQTTNYDYYPLIGLKQITQPNGLNTFYEYDGLNRLKNIKDHNNNLLKNYSYHLGTAGLDASSVTEKTPMVAMTSLSTDYHQVQTHISYYDALGRSAEEVLKQGSNDGSTDILLSNTQYDSYGRANLKILPTTSFDGSGAFKISSMAFAQSFYGDSNPYTENIYENSPLNRVIQTYGAGSAWRTASKYVGIGYLSNAASTVRKYKIDKGVNPWAIYYNVDNQANTEDFYGQNRLYMQETTDERGNKTRTYTDLEGRVIQKEVDADNGAVYKTAYVYNDIGQLTYVVPPKGYDLFSINQTAYQESNQVFLDNIFAYHYDSQGRLIEKHVPGAGWTYTVYNSRGYEAMGQDALQGSRNKWSFTKYDGFNRAIMSGEVSNSQSRASLQSSFDSQSNPYEVRGTSLLNYSNTSTPVVTTNDVRQVMYYDDYAPFSNDTLSFGGSFENQYNNAKGLLTGTRSKSQVSNDWINSVKYYDYLNREIQYQTRYRNNNGSVKYIGGDINHRYTGEELQHWEILQRDGQPNIFTKREQSFDHVGRDTLINYGIGVDGTVALFKMARNKYDGIGRLQQKVIRPDSNYLYNTSVAYITRPPMWLGYQQGQGKTDIASKAVTLLPTFTYTAQSGKVYVAQIGNNGGNITINGLQTIDYSYHIRGMLLGMNLDGSGGASPNTAQGDLFALKLEYETANFYDGNIGKQSWYTSNPLPAADGIAPAVGLRSFTYAYDKANRLKIGTFQGQGSENFSLGTTYDQNGNILTLQRKNKNKGSYQTVDSLAFTYTGGNQLHGVIDAVVGNDDVGDFRDDANHSNNDYAYDVAGNLIRDNNKGISTISYDSYLKKVSQVTWSNGNTLNFYYDGSGNLLKRQASGGDTWEYYGNVTYKNGQPYQVATPEGRAVYSAGHWVQEYEYRDHLGDLRVAFNGKGGQLTASQNTETDPWGLEIRSLSGISSSPDLHKFQKQENIADFGLNVNFFKYRPFDPQIGRGWQIDRLADTYVYNSPYAFSENKVISHVELDGLEAVPTIFFGDLPPMVEPVTKIAAETMTRVTPEPVAPKPSISSLENITKTSSEPVNPVRWNIVRLYRLQRTGSRGGSGAGKDFTEKVKGESFEENGAKNGGESSCENCGTKINRYGKSEKGQTPPEDQAQADHIAPKTPKDGRPPGNNTKENLQWLCRTCNNSKSNTPPEEIYSFPVTPTDNTRTNKPVIIKRD